MYHFRNSCIDFFKNEDTKKDVKEMMTPLCNLIYNEIYVYIWIIAIYNIFSIFIILAIFFIVLRMYNSFHSYPPCYKNL